MTFPHTHHSKAVAVEAHTGAATGAAAKETHVEHVPGAAAAKEVTTEVRQATVPVTTTEVKQQTAVVPEATATTTKVAVPYTAEVATTHVEKVSGVAYKEATRPQDVHVALSSAAKKTLHKEEHKEKKFEQKAAKAHAKAEAAQHEALEAERAKMEAHKTREAVELRARREAVAAHDKQEKERLRQEAVREVQQGKVDGDAVVVEQRKTVPGEMKHVAHVDVKPATTTQHHTHTRDKAPHTAKTGKPLVA